MTDPTRLSDAELADILDQALAMRDYPARERIRDAARRLRQRGTETPLRTIRLTAVRGRSFGHQATPQTAEKMIERKDTALQNIIALCADHGETGSILRAECGTETCGNLEQRAEANRTLFEQQRDKADALEAFLEREGYRSCDIPACSNCGSFYKVERRPEGT